MASTRFRIIGVVLFVVALSALEAYQWDGGPEDKAKITACVGGSASFPWSIVTERDGETILNRDWWFQAPDKEKTLIATYQGKHFYATDNTRVSFLPNAGLSLRYARPQDSGNYSVQVEIQRENLSLASVSRTVTVSIVTPANCVDWLKVDPRSGIRTVHISGEPITVYCDQTTDGGGWIVFQRRQDAAVDFYRTWTEYRKGFGDLEGNFWQGLDTLHSLTTSRRYQLRVDLKMWNETRGYATYSGFYVKGGDNNFRLHFDNFTGGNAGDSLLYHRGQQFSTKDKDHDEYRTMHCARNLHGAWWHKSCHESNLNGDYKTSRSAPGSDGISWYTFGGSLAYSMKFTEMKIRPI